MGEGDGGEGWGSVKLQGVAGQASPGKTVSLARREGKRALLHARPLSI